MTKRDALGGSRVSKLFRQTYTDRAGRTRRSKKWYCRVRSKAGREIRLPLYVSRDASQAVAGRIHQLAGLAKMGVAVETNPELAAWLEGWQDVATQKRLAKHGLLPVGGRLWNHKRAIDARIDAEVAARLRVLFSDPTRPLEEVITAAILSSPELQARFTFRRGTIAWQIRRRVFERDSYTCHLCGQPVDRAEASIDHVVPVSRGGRDDEANLRTAHLSCNIKRGARRIPLEERVAS